jgi:glycosyltransferase 2 family protein
VARIYLLSFDPAGIRLLKLVHRLSNGFRQHWTWLRWVLAILVLAFLFHQHREGVQRLEWSRIHWGRLGLALLCCFSALILTYLRWYLLVWAQDLPFRVQDALRLGFIGYLFNYVAPGAVGGDLIKASMIAREQSERRLVAVATVFLDRVVGLIGLLVLGSVMMLFPSPILNQPEFQYVIGVFQIGSVLSLLGMGIVLLPGITQFSLLRRLVGLPKVGPLFGEFINSIRLYQSRWRVLVLSLLMSFVSHAGLILSIYFCAIALHGNEGVPSLLGHFQIIPPAELVGVVVPLPGGTGALEEAVAHFYVLAEGSFDHGFLTAIAYRLLTIAIAIVGAVWYLFARREIDAALHESVPATAIPDAPAGAPPDAIRLITTEPFPPVP